MLIAKTKSAVRDQHAEWRKAGDSIGLVPTMGFLHDGHMSLVRAACAANDRVIATIFVNPTQFGPNEDLESYPRDMERDLKMLRDAGVDCVFVPSVEEMYENKPETIVETTKLSRILMGRLRPGHYRGVATVVTKLFNICQPDRAYFGEKDYQQVCVVRRMVRDLDMPLDIVGVPTVREADGLAMSSRNVKLSQRDRTAAPVLNRALDAAGSAQTVADARRIIRETLKAEPRADIKSVDIRDAEDLSRVSGLIKRPVVALLAVRFGDVLLIDQRVLTGANT